MASKEELQKLIETIQTSTGKTQADISLGAGYKEKYLSQIMSKDIVSDKVIQNLNKTYKIGVQKTYKKVNSSASMVNEPQAEYKKGSSMDNKDPMAQALADMAASAKAQAEANNKNAEKDLRITAMLENKFSSNALTERLSVAEASFDAFQEYLFEALKDRLPEKSIEELRHVLGKRTAEKLHLI